MKLLDKLMASLGYVPKTAQIIGPVKPSTSPESFPSSTETEDRRRFDLDQNTGPTEHQFSPTTTAPENLSGNTPAREGLPQVDLDQNRQEVMKVVSPENPFQEETRETGGNPYGFPDISQTNKTTPRTINMEEVDKDNHAIAQKMKACGIEYIDRELFEQKMNQLRIKAALAKKPLSEYIDEIL